MSSELGHKCEVQTRRCIWLITVLLWEEHMCSNLLLKTIMVLMDESSQNVASSVNGQG